MFKNLLNKIELLQAELEYKRKVKERKRKSALDIMLSNIRDKAIMYCCQLDSAKENFVAIPPTHKVDTVLFDLIRNEKDVIKYHKRFPYRELAERLG